MTGAEKVVVTMMVGLAATLAQITIQDPAALISGSWPVICSAIAIAATWGAVRARLRGVEKKTDQLAETCATKESVEALDDKVSTVLRIIEARIGERRHEHD